MSFHFHIVVLLASQKEMESTGDDRVNRQGQGDSPFYNDLAS